MNREQREKTLAALGALTKASSAIKDIAIWSQSEQGARLQKLQSTVLGLFEKLTTPLTIHDLQDNFTVVSECIDDALEKTDVLLDRVLGVKKEPQPEAKLVTVTNSKGSVISVFHSKNIVRPQLSFEEKVDNSNAPFVPKLKVKLNAKAPLVHLSPEMNLHLNHLGMDSLHPLQHPYRHEIESIDYPAPLFQVSQEIPYKVLEETEAKWVSTLPDLQELASLLDAQTEIAVDLEHHDYRSFQGFTCLMQISTRTRDFLVDTLALRSSLHLLNSSFTNPNIVKVFHGAEMDIVWLQKDFGLYIVNLFDTFHASKVLELGQYGLAFLLRHFCNVTTDKKYQLADWRIRPLPKEMAMYAQMDTHYLLFIFDKLRNALLQKSEDTQFIRVALSRSEETSRKVYQKDIYDSETGMGSNGWFFLMSKSKDIFNEENFAIFKAIHAWRDHVAREEDESVRYVLPNSMLFTLARVMPTDVQGVIGCCTPSPPLLKLNAHELALLIQETLVETRRNAAAKQLELNKLRGLLEAKEAERAARMAAGPIHSRFEGVDMEKTVSMEIVELELELPVPPVPVKKDTVKSVFWGSLLETPRALSAKALEIRSTLVLNAPSIPSPQMPVPIESIPEKEPIQDSPSKPVEETEDVIMVEAKQSPSIKKKRTKVDFEETDNQWEGIGIPVAKEGLKKKQKKVKEVAQDFTPFDYTQVDSSSTRDASKKDFSPYGMPTDSSKKNKKRKSPGGAGKAGNRAESFR